VTRALLFCPSCRKNVYDSTELYCPDCGTHLIQQPAFSPTPNTASGASAPGSVSSQPAKLTPRTKLVLGVIVLLVIVIGVAAALGGSHSPQPSSPNPTNPNGNNSGKCCFSVQITESSGCYYLITKIDGSEISHSYCGGGTISLDGSCTSEVDVAVYPRDTQSIRADLLLNGHVVKSIQGTGGSFAYSCA